MPHTQSRYMQDLGFNDGRVFAGPGDVVFLMSGGTLSVTRVSAGDYSVHGANSTTGTIAVNLTQQILRRLGFFEDTQQALGSTFGGGLGGFVAGPSGTPGTGIPGSAAPQGRPDTFGAMSALQEITPRTALKIKGFKLNSFDVIYTVSSSNLTAISCRADQIQYVNGAAVPTATVVLASGLNGLSLVSAGTSYVVNVPIPIPAYTRLADQALWIELGVQTPGGGTFDFRGFDCLIEFNFN
jgi:hypothetical protein